MRTNFTQIVTQGFVLLLLFCVMSCAHEKTKPLPELCHNTSDGLVVCGKPKPKKPDGMCHFECKDDQTPPECPYICDESEKYHW